MKRASILRYGALPDQHLELLAGGGDAARRPLVVLLHGGFWRSGYDRTHMNELARALVSAGWSVANVEYRRVPGEPDATLVDVEAALAALPTPDIASDGHLLLVGFSAGGQLALWLAAASGNSRLMGVIGLAPVADLVLAQRLGLSDGAVDEFLGAQTSRLKLIDPRQLPDARCPVRLLHGEVDDVVPISVSESYVAAHRQARLTRLPGSGHMDLIAATGPAWCQLNALLNELALAASAAAHRPR